MAGFVYLSASQQAVEGFAHVGYPQQLRVLLGIAKLLGAVTLLVPGWPRLKEWAYAGFTFAWIAAPVAHYLAKYEPSVHAAGAVGAAVRFPCNPATKPPMANLPES
jgi:hypothetical protein